jgi:malate synthase
MAISLPDGVELRRPDHPGPDQPGPDQPGGRTVLTTEAVAFLATLHRAFDGRRRDLLAARVARAARLAAGEQLGFLSDTASVRADPSWTVAPAPADLTDRRVEITGPVDRKLVINALNSGAQVFMADFEDANAPTWSNVIEGQRNLADAVRRTIELTTPEGREYRLRDETATLVVRPRGWHLVESNLVVDGATISASLFDFGLYFFHNAEALRERGTGPYFYLPKLESHLEARLWNDAFVEAQRLLGIPTGTIRATVLVETILATFEMEEILYELREHSSGLNCGRWDYLFSIIKRFHDQPGFVLADRALLRMTEPFMHAYSLLAIQTCHRRGAHCIGGMAAQIPLKDPDENERALSAVRADKEREASDGHDGAWVAHPALVPIALDAFERAGVTTNQLERRRDDVAVTPGDLLAFGPRGPVTEAGVRTNLSVAIRYLAAWLDGNGCVPINGLMEDMATAEISRSQLWQWLHGDAGVLDDGRPVDEAMVRTLLEEERDRAAADRAGRVDEAAAIVEQLVLADELAEFLSLAATDALEPLSVGD